MSVLEILTWPDPRLSKAAEPVGPLDAEVLRLAEDMLETMYAAEGRGLAGPQVGAMRRIFVMDAGWKKGEATPSVCIDPKILEASGEEVTRSEGCLSIPGIATEITRPEAIRLAWTTREGERSLRPFGRPGTHCPTRDRPSRRHRHARPAGRSGPG